MFSSKKIEISQGDICKLEIDCVVNAANKSLLGGGGVDGAIHRAAGHELLKYCRQLGGAETGEAKITPGFNLNAKYIIHTVGPVWNNGKNNENEKLSLAYKNSLLLADEYKIKEIAFPSISTGAYSFPFIDACHIALKTITKFLPSLLHIEKVVLICYSREDYEMYRKVFQEYSNFN